MVVTSTIVHRQEVDNDKRLCSACFLLLMLSGTLACGMMLPGESPHLTKWNLDNLSHICLEVYLLGESIFHQVVLSTHYLMMNALEVIKLMSSISEKLSASLIFNKLL